MRIFRYILILALLIVLPLYLRGSFSDYQEFDGNIFNTYYRVKIRTPLKDNTLPAKIKQVLQDVDAAMSVFRPDSELSRLNRTPKGEKFVLSAPLAEVLRHAQKINRESGGAFDPAIAPLIDLWGFGPHHQFLEPTDAQLAQVLAYSKFNRLKFSSDFASVTKSDSRTELNLSAIAKGYAVDLVAQTIEDAGFKDYIVEIGGEVRLSGTKNDNGGLWSIGIGVPLQNSRANALTLELSDYAVATSGDYRNFIEQDGQTFSHTISPPTGRPLANELASVTVFAPSCIDADAYATAIMAMGAKSGLRFANRLNLPAIMFLHTPEGQFAMRVSNRAKELIGADHETD